MIVLCCSLFVGFRCLLFVTVIVVGIGHVLVRGMVRVRVIVSVLVIVIGIAIVFGSVIVLVMFLLV